MVYEMVRHCKICGKVIVDGVSVFKHYDEQHADLEKVWYPENIVNALAVLLPTKR